MLVHPWIQCGLRAAMLCVTLTLAACATPTHRNELPSRSIVGNPAGTGATSMDAQLLALDSVPALVATSEKRGRIIFIGAALNSRQNGFDGDVRLLDATFKAKFGSRYRSMLLSNRRLYAGDRILPLATVPNLDRVFNHVAATLRPEDRLIVLLSSHGIPGALEVEQEALFQGEARLLRTGKIAAWMQQVASQPTWLVISACFSGSHLPSLTQPRLLTMTAAAYNRPSFGCSLKDEQSWFSKALADGVAAHQTMGDAWTATVQNVTAREQSLRLPPSLPDLKAGSGMQGWGAAALDAF
jgi:Peptidase C13 family